MSFRLKFFAFAAALIASAGAAAADDLKIALIYGLTGPLQAYAKQTETGLRLGLRICDQGDDGGRRAQDRHHHQGRPGQAGPRQERARRGL